MSVYHNITSWLSEQEISFKNLQHPPTYTSEQSAEYRGEALSVGAKAIVYKIEKAYYLFVLPANRNLDTKKIKQYFKDQGRKAKKTRFATPEELDTLTGLVPGSVPPFGPPILEMELFVDEAILQNEKVAFNAGSLTDSVIMSRADYVEMAKGTMFDFSIEK